MYVYVVWYLSSPNVLVLSSKNLSPGPMRSGVPVGVHAVPVHLLMR